jgi:hypothetical protein
MNRFVAAVGCIASALVLGGCASGHYTAWEAGPDLDASTGRPITRPIGVLADTQIHESRGTASRWWSLAGDEFVPVTIRTGQQVIGAGDVLLAALRHGKSLPLTLHAGDALDVSCQTEWALFSEIMRGERGRPGADSWLLAPGNHDGYLVGNFHPTSDGLYTDGYWRNVCNAGRHAIGGKTVVHDRLRKGELVEAYVRQLLDTGTGVRLPRADNRCPDPAGLCVAYAISTRSWSSFIVQMVRLPPASSSDVPVHAVLLDTSDYATQPRVSPFGVHAGIDAGLSMAQLSAVTSLVARLPERARFFFVGHHPLSAWQVDQWSEEKRAELRRLVADPRSLGFVVTAHTHEGGWFRYRAADIELLELNVGSLSDAPLYYRTLSFETDSAGRIGVVSNRLLMSGLDAGPDCSTYESPKRHSGYAVRDQRSESDRLADAPPLVRRFGAFASAVGHFFAFWRAKHAELAPQLLAYADVVDRTMPADHAFVFHPFGESSGPRTLKGSSAVAGRLRDLAKCSDAHACSVQEKGHLLYSLERYYWHAADTPVAVKSAAHELRYCAAVKSAEEAARISDRERAAVAATLERSAVERRPLSTSRRSD